jgi:uncharacterized membrane protein
MDIRATMQSTLQAARQDRGERAGRRVTAQWIGVGALTALVAAGYTVFVMAQYYTFRISADDLLIFDQAVRSYAHFHLGISPFIGYHLRFGPDYSLLGNHWSPILASLAPVYWIWNTPITLLVAQAVLFALAIPPIWVFTRRAFGGGRKATVAAYLVSVAYAVSWPLASALVFQFHEVAFAPLLMAVALERLQAGQLRGALIALGLLLLVKEDMGLSVAGIGAYLAVSHRIVTRQRLVGLLLIVGGVAYTWIATDVLIPAFGGQANFYWSYSALGSNVPQAAWHVIAHPASTLQLLVTPRVKLDTMLWLFGTFCFLSLLSPIAIATIPLLLERMLADTAPNWWETSFHYNAFLVVVLVCAAADGAARLDRWIARARQRLAARREQPAEATAAAAAADATPAPEAEASPASRPPAARRAGTVALVCAAAICALGLYLIPHFAFGAALHRQFYHRNARMEAAAAAVAVVPSGVTVEAVPYLGPQLSPRDFVLLWDGDGGTPPTYAPWVVANIRQPQFSFHSVPDQKQRVAQLVHDGYKIVFRRRGYLVLHRPGPAGAQPPITQGTSNGS